VTHLESKPYTIDERFKNAEINAITEPASILTSKFPDRDLHETQRSLQLDLVRKYNRRHKEIVEAMLAVYIEIQSDEARETGVTD